MNSKRSKIGLYVVLGLLIIGVPLFCNETSKLDNSKLYVIGEITEVKQYFISARLSYSYMIDGIMYRGKISNDLVRHYGHNKKGKRILIKYRGDKPSVAAPVLCCVVDDQIPVGECFTHRPPWCWCSDN